MKRKASFFLGLVLATIAFSLARQRRLQARQTPAAADRRRPPSDASAQGPEIDPRVWPGHPFAANAFQPALGSIRNQQAGWASHCALRHELAGSEHLRGDSRRRVHLRCQGRTR